jgi:hypothetical protein
MDVTDTGCDVDRTSADLCEQKLIATKDLYALVSQGHAFDSRTRPVSEFVSPQ